MHVTVPRTFKIGLPLSTELSEPTDYRPIFFGLVTDFSQAENRKNRNRLKPKKMLPKPKKIEPTDYRKKLPKINRIDYY